MASLFAGSVYVVLMRVCEGVSVSLCLLSGARRGEVGGDMHMREY